MTSPIVHCLCGLGNDAETLWTSISSSVKGLQRSATFLQVVKYLWAAQAPTGAMPDGRCGRPGGGEEGWMCLGCAGQTQGCRWWPSSIAAVAGDLRVLGEWL